MRLNKKRYNNLQIFWWNMTQMRKKKTSWSSLVVANISTDHLLCPHIPQLSIKEMVSSYEIIRLGTTCENQLAIFYRAWENALQTSSSQILLARRSCMFVLVYFPVTVGSYPSGSVHVFKKLLDRQKNQPFWALLCWTTHQVVWV